MITKITNWIWKISKNKVIKTYTKEADKALNSLKDKKLILNEAYILYCAAIVVCGMGVILLIKIIF